MRRVEVRDQLVTQARRFFIIAADDSDTMSLGFRASLVGQTCRHNNISGRHMAALTIKPATGEELESERLKARLGRR
jgi:hypothetical protein